MSSRSYRDTLVVIPCLNEADHLPSLLDALIRDVPDALVVVADGGSTDGSRSIARHAENRYGSVKLLDNPQRIQSAGVNLAVERYGRKRRWLVRVDAHCSYPADYVSGLVAVAEQKMVASVTVPMRTVGHGCFQRAIAAAQNSVLGTGGSAHRIGRTGRFVDHGHHALMKLDLFVASGGYCEQMTHNEDAELDIRLASLGGQIWLEPSLAIGYYPRKGPVALFRQYLGYGAGRARTAVRHRIRLRARQSAPLAVAPALLLAAAGPLTPLFGVPAAAWALLCLFWGCLLGIKSRKVCECLSGLAAMIMHLAWSLGFWRYLVLGRLLDRREDWRTHLRFKQPDESLSCKSVKMVS